MIRKALLTWYQAHRRPLPWRVLWERHRSPYHVWISEIMLQQTVIKAVLPVYERFLARFPTLADLSRADEDSVRQAVRGLGYYRRFRLLHQAARQLTAESGGAWPETYEAWLALPGIGAYTAAAVSSIAFDQPVAVVDGNVERVLCRLLDLREAPNQPELKRPFQRLANELLSRESPGDFNQAMMELGQTTCTVTTPGCDACPLRFGCLAAARGSQALAPAPRLRPDAVHSVALRLLIVERQGRIGVFPRPRGARFLAGTAGFLTAVCQADGGAVPDGWDDGVAAVWKGGKVIGKVRHSITVHRIQASVETGRLAGRAPAGARWLAPAEVEESLVSNLDRKAWRSYQAVPALTSSG